MSQNKKLPAAVRAHFAKLGRKKSAAKSAAARRNGKKGGRPKLNPVTP